MKTLNSFAILGIANSQHTRIVQTKPSNNSIVEVRGKYSDARIVETMPSASSFVEVQGKYSHEQYLAWHQRNALGVR